jgi:hypothetical protein
MRVESAQWWNNRQAAARTGIPESVYDRHGREHSYDVRFGRRDSAARTTIQSVESEVTVYRDAAGARWAYEQGNAATRHGHMWGATTLGTASGQAQIPIPFHRMGLPDVGTSRAAYSATWGGDEFAYTTCVALFTRGRYTVRLQVTAVQGNTAPHWTARLSRAIDARLRSSA